MVGAARSLAQDTRVDPEMYLGARGGSAGLEPSTGKPPCKYPCLGIMLCLIFLVAVIDELV